MLRRLPGSARHRSGPAARRPGSRWRNTAVTAAVLVAVGAAVVVVARRDEPVALEVEGKPIRNAGAILAQAEAAFGAVVEADGAEAPE
ncbi:MAG: hypothetical protein ACRD03_01515, partial [Acidimicrobiales bacterium]